MNFLTMDLSGYSTPVLKSTSHNSRISNSYSIGFITVDETYENSLLITLAFVPLHLYLHNERKKKRSRIPTTDPPAKTIIHPSMDSHRGPIAFASWIRRPENDHLVVLGKSRTPSAPSQMQIFSFNSKTTSLASSPKVFFFPSF